MRAACRFVQLDENLAAGRRNQKKVHMRPVRPRPSLWINGPRSEFHFQNFCCTFHVAAAKFHLLHSLAKLREIFGNRASSSGRPRRQNIQCNPVGEMQLELLRILIRRHFGQSRQAIRRANFRKYFPADRQTHGHVWRPSAEQGGQLRIRPPKRGCIVRDSPPSTINLHRCRGSLYRITRTQVENCCREWTGHG